MKQTELETEDTMQIGESTDTAMLPGGTDTKSEKPNETGDLAMPLLDDDGWMSLSPLKKCELAWRQRSFSLDNADLAQPGSPLEHAAIDDDVYSLPSMDFFLGDEGDETEGMTSSFGSGPLHGGIPIEVLEALSNPTIDDDSPAAAALRANAGIHVRKVGKLARRVHAQSFRRLVKRATMRNRSGVVRGKPPRLPPSREPGDVLAMASAAGAGEMYVVREEQDDEGSEVSLELSSKSEESNHSETLEAIAKAANAAFEAPSDNLVDVDERKKKAGREQIANDMEKIPAEVSGAALVLAKKDPEEIAHGHRWKRRKRRRKKKERNKSYVKGKVINGEHELYALSIAVMLGVRTSISKTNAIMMSSPKAKRWLSSDDFMAAQKYEFSPKGGQNTPPHQLSHTFKFKDYSPLAFAYLRRMFGVNEYDFLLSVCGNANFIEFISNAKSGQFFFYSSDGKYMIKTMTNAESKFLRRILPHYFHHCAENPNTLITKFLGMYRVKMYHLRRNVKFVIMNSVYCTDKHLQTFYDLKGSTVGRDAKPGQEVRKDNDMRVGLPESAIALQPGTRERVREQIVADCKFMERMKIMDYSMLIGTHHIPPREQESQSLSQTESKQLGLNRGRPRRDNLSFRELVRQHTAPASPGHHSFPTSAKNNQTASPSVPAVHSMPESGGSQRPRPRAEMHEGNRGYRPASPSERSFEALTLSSGGTAPAHEQKKADIPKAELLDDFLDLNFADLQDFEHGYDDDDDDSFLEGSEHHHRTAVDEASVTIALKKELTIEKIYWPFHRYYDIHGYRRMHPGVCLACGSHTCTCTQRFEDISGLKLPSFVRPLSDRKDCGLIADTSGLELPMIFRAHGKEQHYEGKIFYMGIIDILQQYNLRKRVEARYRRALGSGWQSASCVQPKIYAERFIRFFDEYSQRQPLETEVLGENDEQIVFERDHGPSKGRTTKPHLKED